MAERKAANTAHEARSLHWWKIMAHTDAATLIFREYYEELVGPEDAADLLAADETHPDLPSWEFEDGANWGEDSALIEDWFAVGAELRDPADWEEILADGWEEGKVLAREARQRPVSGNVRFLSNS